MASWISLQKTDTGFVFARTHGISGSPWTWITEVVAAELECSPEDLSCGDDEDGEFVALNGASVVRIHDCYLRNDAPALQLREVA